MIVRYAATAAMAAGLALAVDIPPNQAYTDYSAQNSGKTGLIEMPTARVMDDWRIRPHFYYSNPFIYYGLAVAPLPRLEMNFRITQLRGVAGFTSPNGYGDYKDKAIDLKFLLAREDTLLPAVAVGADDIQGTGLFSSKYLVATKRVDFLDVTGGYALGRMGGEDLRTYTGSGDRAFAFLMNSRLRGGSFFGGLECHVTPDLSLKAEYSPIKFSIDPVSPFAAGQAPLPTSHMNFGVQYRMTPHVNLALNYERGNAVGFALVWTIPFGSEGLYDHRPDPKWRADDRLKQELSVMDDRNLSYAVANEIAAERFANVQVAVNGDKMWAAIENPRYNSPMQALGRTADVVDEVAPERVNELYLALKQTNREYAVVRVGREKIKEIKHERYAMVRDGDLVYYDDTDKAYDEFRQGRSIGLSEPIGGKKFAWLFKPSLQTFLNDKENPFTYKFSLLVGARYEIAPGGFVLGRLRFPLANTTGSITPLVLEPAQTATRTDSLRYLQYNGIQLHDLAYDQTFKLPINSYGRFEIGYFEPAYGGIDAEWYKPLAGGRYGVGVEYQLVRKRRVDSLNAFDETTFSGKFVNLYANIVPELGISTSARIGQFFAGDRGVSMTLMRKFHDFTIGAFLTKTDTGVFQSPDNRNYIDKGVFLTIPLSTISPDSVKGSLTYSLKPWTRDVGQYAGQMNSLVGMSPANVFELSQDVENFRR